MYKKEYKYYRKHTNYGYIIVELNGKDKIILGTIKKESKAKLIVEALTLLTVTRKK